MRKHIDIDFLERIFELSPVASNLLYTVFSEENPIYLESIRVLARAKDDLALPELVLLLLLAKKIEHANGLSAAIGRHVSPGVIEGQVQECAGIHPKYADNVRLALLASRLRCDTQHFRQVEAKTVDVKAPDKAVALDVYGKLFKDCFSNKDEKLRCEGEQKSAGELHKGILDLISQIEKKEARVGAPSTEEKRAIFYRNLSHMLQHMYPRMREQPREFQKTILMNIAYAGPFCSTRSYQEVYNYYRVLCPDSQVLEEVSEDARQKDIYAFLAKMRYTTFLQILPNANAHTYNYFMHLVGKELGLSAPGASYQDPTAPQELRAITKEDFLAQFHASYSPFSVVLAIQEAFSNKGLKQGDFVALLSDLRPPGISDEFFSEHCFNEDGHISAEGISYVLIHLGILKIENAEHYPLLEAAQKAHALK